MRQKAIQTITIDVNADEKEVEKLCDYLAGEFANGDWECEVDRITAKEVGYATFYKGCPYTKNGDGYPDDWDLEFELYEDDIEESIEKYINENDADITDWRVYTDYETEEGF